MDELDKKLYHDLNLEIQIPNKCEEIIKRALHKKKQHYSLPKVAITACVSLTLMVGIVYASKKVSEKIWREPEKVEGYQIGEYTISEKDIKGIINKTEATEKAKKILEKFGYTGEKIKTIELEKNSENDLKWSIKTEDNISLDIDAKGGKGIRLFFDSILYKDIDKYRTTKAKAEQTARDFCKKYGYDLSDYKYVGVDSNLGEESESYIWYVNFCKEYDKIIDGYNAISIGFIPEINELYYFTITEKKYENNPVQITKEQARETALLAEQKTNLKYKIKNTEVNLGIELMNGNAHARTTDYKQFCEQYNTADYPKEKMVEYRTDKRLRKVWKVMIEYNIPKKDIFTKGFNNDDLGYIYFVDTTTGEIIGGEDYNKSIKN